MLLDVREESHFDLGRLPAAAVLDVNSGPRLDDLMLAADVLIADYSPLVFDYANLDRPIVLLIDKPAR